MIRLRDGEEFRLYGNQAELAGLRELLEARRSKGCSDPVDFRDLRCLHFFRPTEVAAMSEIEPIVVPVVNARSPVWTAD